MGTKFRKSVKIAPGVKLNISKKSVGVSIGGKHGGVSINSKNCVRARVSAPGTGISYSQKIGGNRNVVTKKKSGNIFQPATPRKSWFIFLEVLFLLSGFLALFIDNVIAGVITFAIGAIMLIATIKSPKKIKIDVYQLERQTQIFDESLKIIMKTENPETFFERYDTARAAVNVIAQMTDEPVLHEETPQSVLESLENSKEEITNAFLTRYANKIKMYAFNLTRGRKQKLETFNLMTTNFESKMTAGSIEYRDKLYSDMLSDLESLTSD